MSTSLSSPSIRQLTHSYGLEYEFYRIWLDPYLTYSCANWDAAQDLASAQLHKLDAALDSLLLPEGGSFLDVGCGWGSLLRRGAERGYRGKGIVPVAKQAEYCAAAGFDVFAGKWEAATGPDVFDGIASIGAFEHFAARKATPLARADQYRRFFAWASDGLRARGRLYLQTICFLDDRLADPGQLPRDVIMDIVRRFYAVRSEWPNSMLPTSLAAITTPASEFFEVVSVRARRHDYGRTCATWLERIRSHRRECVELVGKETVARFEAHLGASTPCFEEGWLTLYQIVFQKKQAIPGLY